MRSYLLGGRSVPLQAIALPALRVRGHCFEQADGTHWTAIQCSDFHLFGRFLNGEEIRPVLEQRAAIGFNLLRVWTRYQLAAYGIGDCTLAMHPDLYQRVPAFVDLCASYGLYVEFTAYTGREDFDPHHWSRLGVAGMNASTPPLLELVNENDQGGNHIDASAFEPIGLCSHGSNGSQARPVEPFWEYATFHTNGAPEEQRKVGHNAMEIWSGPTLTNETSRYPDVGMWGADAGRNQQVAFDSAAGAALLCAGSCFHSAHGKNSTLFDAETQAVAQAWVNGARSVDLSQQDESYAHRSDLETAGILRVYQRGTCIVTIRS